MEVPGGSWCGYDQDTLFTYVKLQRINKIYSILKNEIVKASSP